MISCQDVSKNYGNVKALNMVSISCKQGEIHGLVGANGAGKTTLFKILLNLVTPDTGTLEVIGEGAKKLVGLLKNLRYTPT